jgi:hypothetical protein
MNLRFIPWLLVLIVSFFVYGLTYYTEHKEKPAPSYDFYEPAIVQLEIAGEEDLHSVYGQYLNILEGKRETVEAQDLGDGNWRLDFSVNSPRPAMLYIDDEPLEVFLVPGDSTLQISMEITGPEYRIDSLQFTGEIAGICGYLQSKYKRFSQVQLRSSRSLVEAQNFEVFAAKLDSMAARELAFLAEQEVFSTLPNWFVKFEKNDILYQKAYLKISQAYNQDINPDLLDDVPLSNESAMFSYYYYLYLTARFNEEAQFAAGVPAPDDPLYHDWAVKQTRMADFYLQEGPRDVFMTRIIFDMLQNRYLEEAEKLLDRYGGEFASKKYYRFLNMQLEKRLENENL